MNIITYYLNGLMRVLSKWCPRKSWISFRIIYLIDLWLRERVTPVFRCVCDVRKAFLQIEINEVTAIFYVFCG